LKAELQNPGPFITALFMIRLDYLLVSARCSTEGAQTIIFIYFVYLALDFRVVGTHTHVVFACSSIFTLISFFHVEVLLITLASFLHVKALNAFSLFLIVSKTNSV